MGENNAFRDLAKSLTEDSSPEAVLKSEHDDDDEDVLNESFCESASSKSYDSSSAKLDKKNDENTNGSSFDRNESNKSTSADDDKPSVEYEEKPAVALVRNNDDVQSELAGKPKKKKSKAKKENSILPISFVYQNKPKGYSTSTQYVGDDDDEDDYASGFLPMEGEKQQQNGLKSSHITANDDDDEIITDSVSSASTKSHDDVKINKERIAELESQIASAESKSQRHLDENVRIKAQNKVLSNDKCVLKEELDGLTKKISQLESNLKTDSRKVIEERDKLKEKVQILQKELAGKQEEVERISAEKTAFIQRIQTLEKEKKAAQQKPVQQQLKMTDDRNRAICAELTVVSLQKNFETDILQRALKDARKIVGHLEIIVPKCTPEDAVTARKYQDRFKVIVAKFETDIEKMKREFDAQMELIKNGTRLSILKRIEPPRPPSPPPMLELKTFPPNQSSNRPQMMPINPPHMFSARSAGDMFRPPFMTASNSQPSLPPRPLFPPMMNGFSCNRPMIPPGPRMPTTSSNNPSGFNNSGAIPRAQSNAAAHTDVHPTTRHATHADVAPPGLQSNFYFPIPQQNSGNFVPNTPSNESKLFAALNGNVRRNPEPFFKEPAVYHPLTNFDSPKKSPSIPSSLSPDGAAATVGKEKKPMTKLQGIIDLFLERFPSAKDDIKEAITVFRSSLPGKNLQGVTMNQLKNGLEPILTKKFGQPLFSKSGDSTRASSVVDEITYQQPEPRYHHQSEEECFICYENKSDLPMQTLECGHEAHKECLDKWILDNKTCPICRMWTLSDDEYPRL